MVRAELDLSGQIKDNISVLPQRFQFLIQPVEVLFKVFHAVQHSPVGAKTVCVHDIVEGDQGGEVDRASVWNVVVRRVEVYDRYWSVECR